MAKLAKLVILTLCLCIELSFSSLTSAFAQTIGGCQMFPSNNIWNYDISNLPLHPKSNEYINSIGSAATLHPDFGSGLWDGGPIGIPYTMVPSSQHLVPITFEYNSESDPGPYPIPPNAPIEGGPNSTGDRHILIVQQGSCKLFETFSSYPQTNGSWQAGSGAVWDLNFNNLRPETWTSADAAGLPILPGLVRYDEILAGEIKHALRFTASRTQRAYVWPARHFASSITDTNVPPLGIRVRLKPSFNVSTFSSNNQIILNALKKYGMFLADNGSNWYISGSPDERWNNDELRQLKTLKGSDFEVVDESSLMGNINSGAVLGTSPNPTQTQLPTTSPTSSRKQGDCQPSTGDGDVDIFDYNALVSNFGSTTNLACDFVNLGAIDIFDYNIVVSNFGI